MSTFAFIFFLCLAWAQEIGEEGSRSGEYLLRMAGCRDCHSFYFSDSMSGGYALETPFGIFYSPNITPHKTAGIGDWTFDDFYNALRYGYSPEGRYYYPSFPYRSYTKLTDEDMKLMFDYLMRQEPVDRENREHKLDFPYNQRSLNYAWQVFFFHNIDDDKDKSIKVGVGPFIADEEKTARWNRGAYLVEGLFHCTECHTPRGYLGEPLYSQWMAGSLEPIAGEMAPNITPGGLTWSKEDWDLFLKSGFTPEGKSVGGDMALVIQNTSALTEYDRQSVIEYLMSLKPVEVP